MDTTNQQQEASQPIPLETDTSKVRYLSLRKTVVMVLVGLVFLGILGGAYFLGVKYGGMTMVAQEAPQPSVVPSFLPSVSPTPHPHYKPDTTPFPTIAVGSDWKVYADKQFGYRFSYPSGAAINSGNYLSGGPNDYLYNTTVELNLSPIHTIPGPLDGYLVSVTTGDFISPEKGNIRLTQAIDVAEYYYSGDEAIHSKVTPIMTTTIAGRKAYTYTQHDAGPGGGNGNGYDWVHYFVDSATGKPFMVDIICDSTDSQKVAQYRKIANTIVSTFSFE